MNCSFPGCSPHIGYELQQGHISLPCEHSLFQASVSGTHSYAATGFRVLPDVSATWMWIYATCINIPVASLLYH